MLSSHTVQIAPISSNPTAARNTTLYDFCSSSIRSLRRAIQLPLWRSPPLQKTADGKDRETQQHQVQLAPHAVLLGHSDVERVANVGDAEGLNDLGEEKHARRAGRGDRLSSIRCSTRASPRRI